MFIFMVDVVFIPLIWLKIDGQEEKKLIFIELYLHLA
jgi:hypothetical protein